LSQGRDNNKEEDRKGSPEDQHQQEEGGKKSRGRVPALVWVLGVLLAGGIVGELSYLFISGSVPQFPNGPDFAFLQYHSILSTVSIALLFALLVVYGKTYVQTKANFILGLIVVLLALLLQNLLTYPIIHPFIDNTPFESMSISSPVADVFTIIAYTVFLYLSLE